MRIFIGIEIPEEIKKYIHQYLLPLQTSPKGWENPHDYHQTLLFIGESDEKDVEEIKVRMTKIILPSFELELEAFRFFNRRVMYLGFCYSEQLMRLKELVERTFAEWIKPQSKAFVPHLTVKRWQRYEFSELEYSLNANPFKSLKFWVDNLSLFKSEKDTENRKYHVIHRVKLFTSGLEPLDL